MKIAENHYPALDRSFLNVSFYRALRNSAQGRHEFKITVTCAPHRTPPRDSGAIGCATLCAICASVGVYFANSRASSAFPWVVAYSADVSWHIGRTAGHTKLWPPRWISMFVSPFRLPPHPDSNLFCRSDGVKRCRVRWGGSKHGQNAA